MFNTFGGNIPSAGSERSLGEMLAARLANVNRFTQPTRSAYDVYGISGDSDYDSQIVTRPNIRGRTMNKRNNMEIGKIIEAMIAQRMGQEQQPEPEAESEPQIAWADMSGLAPDVQSLPGAARAWSGAPMSYKMYGGR